MQHLSLGEEQSDSIVISLAWSPPGLSLHRRSALAVLTSNLLLSIWETDGNSGSWRRTTVINGHLTVPSDADTDKNRRSKRVRAFAWTRPLKLSQDEKWGICHLLIADDNGFLSLLRLSKHDEAVLGDWRLKVVAGMTLQQDMDLVSDEDTSTLLQQTIQKKSPVTQISPGEWFLSDEVTNDTETKMQVELQISRGPCRPARVLLTVCVQSTLHCHEVASQMSHLTVPTHQHSMQNGQEQASNAAMADPFKVGFLVNSITSRWWSTCPEWKEPLRSICRNYDSVHKLAGNYRVRFWGVSRLKHQDVAVACITLHPSDLYEYTTGSIEKCYLIFSSQGGGIPDVASRSQAGDYNLARRRIISLVAELSKNPRSTPSHLDEKIVRVCRDFASAFASDGEDGLSLQALTSAVESAGHPSGSENMEEHAQTAIKHRGVIAEHCEACCAPLLSIYDTRNFVEGQCINGHIFTRCSLSFVTIQEPGISKYCAQCGKQFLDLRKFDISSGPSLSQALFTKFDVCPYCNGKYRG